MSRIVPVYDPKRNPTEWNRMLAGSQVAVFVEDARAELPVRNSSNQPTCELFDNIDLAGLHCKQVVIDNPRLRCLIFDSRGRGGGPIAVYEHPKLRTGELTGPFRRWFSATLILASIVLIWADWRSDFERMWPSILAWKLLTTALVFITWEFALFVQTLLEKRGIQMR
jgi:hypothetical protein